MEWQRVAAPGEIEDGTVRLAVVGDRRLAVGRSGATYFALDGACPHAGGPLHEGSLEDGRLVCPWHGHEFDVATGRCESFQDVACHAVEVRPDGIYVRCAP